MTKRSILAVILLSLFTGGLYNLYWYITTKDEMVAKGATIPTGWLLLIPIANIYWTWKWSEGVEYVTHGRTSAVGSFIMSLLLGCIGMAILQSMFNEISDEQESLLPQARIA